MNALPNPFDFESAAVASPADGSAAALTPPADAAAGPPIPAGYVLVERELLGRVVKRLQTAAAIEREQLRGRMIALLERKLEAAE